MKNNDDIKLELALHTPCCTGGKRFDVTLESFEGADGIRLKLPDKEIAFSMSVESARKLAKALKHFAKLGPLTSDEG